MVSAMTEVYTGCSDTQRENQGKESWSSKQGITNELVGEQGQTGDRGERIDKTW